MLCLMNFSNLTFVVLIQTIAELNRSCSEVLLCLSHVSHFNSNEFWYDNIMCEKNTCV